MKNKLSINVEFDRYSRQQKIPAELLPMLVTGSTYQNKTRQSCKPQVRSTIICNNTPEKFKGTKDRYYFKFYANNNEYHIPAIELARTLFLHNIHLTRTAFRPNGLAGLATISDVQTTHSIKFHRLSDYPLTSIRSISARNHLIWLLFDADARKSFNSIYHYLVKSEGQDWHFNFDSPPLKDWMIKVAGRVDISNPNLIHVDEIESLHNPAFNYPHQVEITHPKIKKQISPLSDKKSRSVVFMPDDETELDFGLPPKLGGKRDIENESSFSFSFAMTLSHQLAYEEERLRHNIRINLTDSKEVGKTGIGHGEQEGTAQEFDYGINRNDLLNPETEHNEINEDSYTDRFQSFQQVIRNLANQPDCELMALRCFELPKPERPRNACIYKSSQKQRQYHLAHITYRKLPITIIEVDLNELPESYTLSTLTLVLQDGNDSLKAIMQACSNEGIHWDKNTVKSNSVVSKTPRHPHRVKRNSNKNKLMGKTKSLEEYNKDWVDTLNRAMQNLYNSV